MVKRGDKSRDKKVLTPGGYRSPRMVHLVKPGEIVQGRGGETRVTTDLVLTPGGFRSRSLVHLIEPNHELIVEHDKFRIQNMHDLRETEVAMVPWGGDVPALVAGGSHIAIGTTEAASLLPPSLALGPFRRRPGCRQIHFRPFFSLTVFRTTAGITVFYNRFSNGVPLRLVVVHTGPLQVGT
jgi:hypothetical protein